MTYPYWANIIITDISVGNQVASLIDPDGGSQTFGRIGFRQAGSSGPATAWGADTPLTASGKAIFDEFAGNGPYPLLNAAGITDVQALKAVFIVESGGREIEKRLADFAAENGYERVAQ